MTLNTNYQPLRQLGNGKTTSFSYDFDAIKEKFLVVIKEVNGIQNIVNPSEYSIVSGETGGIVNFFVPPTAEETIIIARDVELSQEVPFKTSSGFQANIVEEALDKLTGMNQQLNDGLNRSLKLPIGTNLNISLPLPSAGKTLVWADNETSLKNSEINIENLETELFEAVSSASDSADNAKISEDKAKDSEDKAKDSENKAKDSEDKAKASEIQAAHNNFYICGSILEFDAPVNSPYLKPLNDRADQETGLLLEHAKEFYPAFWDLCIERKNKAKEGNTDFERYNKTQTEYAAELEIKGFCGFYVVDDDVDSETFGNIRLPYFGWAYTQGYSAGEINKTAGLPNIAGSVDIRGANQANGIKVFNEIGALKPKNTNNVTFNEGAGGVQYTTNGLEINASLSSPIYGNSPTVQTDTIGVYYYIVVGNMTDAGIIDLVSYTAMLQHFSEVKIEEVEAFTIRKKAEIQGLADNEVERAKTEANRAEANATQAARNNFYVCGSILEFDAPVNSPYLKPLNDRANQDTGLLLEHAKEFYPAFWDLCLERKNKAKSGNTDFARYNKTQNEYAAELEVKGFCGFYVIDDDADSETFGNIRLPYFGWAYTQGYSAGEIDKTAGLPNIDLALKIDNSPTLDSTGYYGPKLSEYGNDDIGGACARISSGLDEFMYNMSTAQPIYKAGDLLMNKKIYGTSNTVQTDSIGIYYYIVVGNMIDKVDIVSYTAMLQNHSEIKAKEIETFTIRKKAEIQGLADNEVERAKNEANRAEANATQAARNNFYVCGSILEFDAPVNSPYLKPLNDRADQETGLLLEHAKDFYPAFWDLCVERKQKAKEGNPDFARYNKTQNEYAAELEAKGFCGFYVVDDDADIETFGNIRLPYFGWAYTQGYSAGEIDKTAGLPNIAGWLYTGNAQTTNGGAVGGSGGAFTEENPSMGVVGGNWSYGLGRKYHLNASRSSAVYGNSPTTQTDSIGIYYYIVVGNTIETTPIVNNPNIALSPLYSKSLLVGASIKLNKDYKRYIHILTGEDVAFSFDCSDVTNDFDKSFYLNLNAKNLVEMPNINFPANVYWANEIKPELTTAGVTHLLIFETDDNGASWFGRSLGFRR